MSDPRGGGMPGIGLPGMGGMPGVGKRASARQRPQAVKKKGKRVSGNPAKRAAAAAQSGGDQQQRPASGAEAFGFPGASKTDFEIPKELKDLL
jgi:signal recognition particle subunit SRP54